MISYSQRYAIVFSQSYIRQDYLTDKNFFISFQLNRHDVMIRIRLTELLERAPKTSMTGAIYREYCVYLVYCIQRTHRVQGIHHRRSLYLLYGIRGAEELTEDSFFCQLRSSYQTMSASHLSLIMKDVEPT